MKESAKGRFFEKYYESILAYWDIKKYELLGKTKNQLLFICRMILALFSALLGGGEVSRRLVGQAARSPH